MAIAGLGLSINVISLAGLAFAVGMVVDASIVSLENIFRLRQSGIDAHNAAYHGARQVWAPILGSALTTVIVFIPVLMLDLPVGQLFHDIGIAISVSVLISVVVSVTVIPTLSARLLGGSTDRFSRLPSLPVIDPIAQRLAGFFASYAALVVRRKKTGAGIVAALLAAGVFASVALMPKLDYLPDGNANSMFGRISVAGYSMDEPCGLPNGWKRLLGPCGRARLPRDRLSTVSFSLLIPVALLPAHRLSIRHVLGICMVLMRCFAEPGARAFVQQASLFGRSVGGSRVVSIDIVGPNADDVLPVAVQVNDALSQKFPRRDGNQIRTLPGLDSGAPQIRITPDLTALARAGVSVREFTAAIDVFNDGTNVSQVPIEGQLVDMVLSGADAENLTASDLRDIPVITKAGNILRVGQLGTVEVISAPAQVRRLGGTTGGIDPITTT